MATDLENLKTRRSAILTELAALSSTASGGKPNYTINGQSVDHIGYKRSLYDELKTIDELIVALQGPFEVVSEVVT